MFMSSVRNFRSWSAMVDLCAQYKKMQELRGVADGGGLREVE